MFTPSCMEIQCSAHDKPSAKHWPNDFVSLFTCCALSTLVPWVNPNCVLAKLSLDGNPKQQVKADRKALRAKSQTTSLSKNVRPGFFHKSPNKTFGPPNRLVVCIWKLRSQAFRKWKGWHSLCPFLLSLLWRGRKGCQSRRVRPTGQDIQRRRGRQSSSTVQLPELSALYLSPPHRILSNFSS